MSVSLLPPSSMSKSHLSLSSVCASLLSLSSMCVHLFFLVVTVCQPQIFRASVIKTAFLSTTNFEAFVFQDKLMVLKNEIINFYFKLLKFRGRRDQVVSTLAQQTGGPWFKFCYFQTKSMNYRF